MHVRPVHPPAYAPVLVSDILSKIRKHRLTWCRHYLRYVLSPCSSVEQFSFGTFVAVLRVENS